jgi:UDP-N-acetylglucosamine 2-epimerase (non-hydrolysing)
VKTLRIMSVVGARPNFMKIAPLYAELCKVPSVEHLLVHSGQHYSEQMSGSFFRDLQMPEPQVNLEVGSGSHASQTAEVMKRFEPVVLDWRPELVVVVGDVNSTLAAALVASKLGVKLAHIEAGLRSFDMTMPEEINRKLTDAVSDFLFVTEESGVRNLESEGAPKDRIFLVGNAMIDTLLRFRSTAAQSAILKELGLRGGSNGNRPYAVLTLHRPANVDDPVILRQLLECLGEVSKSLPILFPIHPRSKERVQSFGLGACLREDSTQPATSGIVPIPPLSYLDFLCLMDHARLVLTDSGGIQEETTVLGVPCLTLRENTERPVTVEHGTNQIVGRDSKRIVSAAREILQGGSKAAACPPLWDGHAAERIVRILLQQLRPELAAR